MGCSFTHHEELATWSCVCHALSDIFVTAYLLQRTLLLYFAASLLTQLFVSGFLCSKREAWGLTVVPGCRLKSVLVQFD